MSLFHIDAGREWRGGQRQALFLARELRKKGYPFQLVVQPESPLHAKAAEDGLPVLPIAHEERARSLVAVLNAWPGP